MYIENSQKTIYNLKFNYLYIHTSLYYIFSKMNKSYFDEIQKIIIVCLCTYYLKYLIT